jgi:hypothetical protein
VTAPPQPNEGARPVLLYDGDCRFCRFAARLVARADRHKRLAFAPANDLESIRLVLPDGHVREGGAALAALLGSDRLSPVLDPPYRLVARFRGALGRLVPDGPGPVR